jgi:hypothetical protein
MHRSRAPSIAPGTFFVAQPWADCITNMPGFNLRQAQLLILLRRFATELAREEARMLCDELMAEEAIALTGTI